MHFDEADLHLLDRLVEAFPDEPDALRMAVWHYIGRGKGKEVEKHWKNLDPNLPFLIWEQALELNKAGLKDEAEAKIQELLNREDLTPAWRAYFHTQLGWAGFNLGHFPEKGRQHLEEAIRLNPMGWGPLQVYARGLWHRGETEEALVQYRKAYALAPQNRSIRWELAELLLFSDRFDEAVPLYEATCKEDQHIEACAKYTYVLHRVGRHEEARVAAAATEALKDELEGHLVDGPIILARYYAQAGDQAGAIRMLRRHVQNAPESEMTGPILRANYQLTPLRGNPDFDAVAAVQWKKAAKEFGEACDSEPNSTDCSLHAVALHLLGRDVEAREAAATAASLEEDELGCLYLAWYHACARNREKVIRYLTCYADRAKPIKSFKLGEHEDYAWIRGDPEFDAVAFRIAGYDYETEDPPE
jgi:Flp pilus assembly protein TadD